MTITLNIYKNSKTINKNHFICELVNININHNNNIIKKIYFNIDDKKQIYFRINDIFEIKIKDNFNSKYVVTYMNQPYIEIRGTYINIEELCYFLNNNESLIINNPLLFLLNFLNSIKINYDSEKNIFIDITMLKLYFNNEQNFMQSTKYFFDKINILEKELENYKILTKKELENYKILTKDMSNTIDLILEKHKKILEFININKKFSKEIFKVCLQ